MGLLGQNITGLSIIYLWPSYVQRVVV